MHDQVAYFSANINLQINIKKTKAFDLNLTTYYELNLTCYDLKK